MTGAEIYALIMMFGPEALNLAHWLATNWNKQLSPDEVQAQANVSRLTLQQLNAEARAKLAALGQLPVETQAAAEKRLDKVEGAQA